jgi:hypothetical protein
MMTPGHPVRGSKSTSPPIQRQAAAAISIPFGFTTPDKKLVRA